MPTLIELRAQSPTPVHGYLAIDSLVGGAAHGGLRIADDVSADLLQEAATTMTLKYGFAHLPVGGAKAGIVAPLEIDAEARKALLTSFGIALRPYLQQGVYVPGEDMGSSEADIEVLMRAAGLKPLPRSLMYSTSGYFTGVGVCATALATAAHLGINPTDLRVVVEGLGAVGSSAVAAFHSHGVRVLAVSTSRGAVFNPEGLDIPLLLQMRQEDGNDVVNRDGLGEPIAPVDVASIDCEAFIPCAIMHSIDMRRVRLFRARMLVPGANVPCTTEAERVLTQRGVVVVPDFAANCGGVLGSSIVRAGLPQREVATIVARRQEKEISALLEESRRRNTAVRTVATELSRERFDRARRAYERPGLTGRVFRVGVALHRRGLVPRRMLAPVARWYFVRRLHH